jgi:uncharacterized OsmC-like protein
MDVRALQAPLRERYTNDPSSAAVTLRVRNSPSDLADPLHCSVAPEVPGVVWRSGAHPAVGGVGDVPCSGDLLLGALAACQEVTMRMVAANQGFDIEEISIEVEGDWDPRGTLAMGRGFPVGLTAIRCATKVRLAGEVDQHRAERFLQSAERYCVVLDTLRGGVDVTSTFELLG